jgi:pyruvate/2-oxoglutarate dehydrogenase complex dihydrolipoamide dehydrogenase (E3) component
MEPWLEDRGVQIVRGAGKLDGDRRVVVGDDTLVAGQAVVVATGSGPAMPPIDGLREAKPWTNREATTAKEAPGRLTILGGGVVGVEMAQAWRTLGSQVTLIEAGDRLLAREEPFASEHVEQSLREHGVDVRKGAKAAAVRSEGGDVVVELDSGDSIPGDELLVAIGRRPNTTNLGVETIGLEPGKPIAVGPNLRSAEHDWLYAIGDANGRSLLTHMGKYHGRLAADAILGKEVAVRFDGFQSPRVIFTDPQVAAVGHTLASALEAGIRAHALDVETGWTAGGAFVGRNTVGTSRVVVDEDRGVLVGATFTGFETAELIHGATIAIAGEVPLEILRHAVPSFPTRSELWNLLLEQVGF